MGLVFERDEAEVLQFANSCNLLVEYPYWAVVSGAVNDPHKWCRTVLEINTWFRYRDTFMFVDSKTALEFKLRWC